MYFLDERKYFSPNRIPSCAADCRIIWEKKYISQKTKILLFFLLSSRLVAYHFLFIFCFLFFFIFHFLLLFVVWLCETTNIILFKYIHYVCVLQFFSSCNFYCLEGCCCCFSFYLFQWSVNYTFGKYFYVSVKFCALTKDSQTLSLYTICITHYIQT